MPDTRLAEAASLSPGTAPGTVIQILCQNATQEAGKGKVEGQQQTKITLCLSRFCEDLICCR